MNYKNFPTKVGVACIIHSDRGVLMGKRMNSHGHGMWAFPGGHIEDDETPFECALRETREETNLIVNNPKIVTWSFDSFVEKEVNYITLFVETHLIHGEAILMEPDKCESWQWFAKRQLPTPVFSPVNALFSFGYKLQ